MRSCLSVVVVVIAWSAAPARADTASSVRTLLQKAPDMALGVNVPVAWLDGHKNVAASALVRVVGRHAVRLNVASYDYVSYRPDFGDWFKEYGGFQDLGVSWVWYPGVLGWYSKAMWQGLNIELGALLRKRDTEQLEDREDYFETEQIKTTSKAGRLMVGWSAVGNDLWFLAIGGGVSVGRERGTETTGSIDHFLRPDMLETRQVSRRAIEPEFYLRVGIKLGK